MSLTPVHGASLSTTDSNGREMRFDSQFPTDILYWGMEDHFYGTIFKRS